MKLIWVLAVLGSLAIWLAGYFLGRDSTKPMVPQPAIELHIVPPRTPTADDDAGPPSEMDMLRMQVPARPSYCDRPAYRDKPECQPKYKLRWHSGSVVGC